MTKDDRTEEEKQEDWELDQLGEAMEAFYDAHGRKPTQSEFHSWWHNWGKAQARMIVDAIERSGERRVVEQADGTFKIMWRRDLKN